jgi:hypothetical protein
MNRAEVNVVVVNSAYGDGEVVTKAADAFIDWTAIDGDFGLTGNSGSGAIGCSIVGRGIGVGSTSTSCAWALTESGSDAGIIEGSTSASCACALARK